MQVRQPNTSEASALYPGGNKSRLCYTRLIFRGHNLKAVVVEKGQFATIIE